MIDLSDSESSAPNYSSPDDDDYKTSDGDDNGDGDHTEQDDYDSEDEKTKAVRHGFSLHHSTNSHSPKTPEGKQWLSTQPASQSSLVSSGTKKRRISPRRNGPTGMTSVIVGVIQGEPNAMDTLVIPKKKKFQRQQQQQQQATEKQHLAGQQLQTHQSQSQTQTQSQPQPQQQPQPQPQQQQQQQQQQPPMKKRKVSLSPTDSLARQHPSIRGGDDSREEKVIDLLAAAATVDDYEISSSSPKAFASKKIRIAQEEVLPQRLSPSSLAAASKQQKEHVEATKQKQKSKKTNASLKKEMKPPKRLSKVSQVSYAEDSTGKPASTDPLPPNDPKAKQEGRPNQNVPPPPPASSSKTKSDRSNAKSDFLSKASESKEFDTGKTKAAVAAETNSAATQSKAKKTQVAKMKTNNKATVTVGSTKDFTPMSQATNATTTTAKPLPPKNKKKKRITFEHELLQKMFLACRPYSTRDLVQLMGKTTSEASINFCLLSLIDKKWVIKKDFKSGNRTKELYWANQESRDKKLWAMECLQLPNTETITGGRLELATLQQQLKSLIREIEIVEKTPSNQHLSTLCHNAQKEADDLSEKLESMKGRIASSSASALHPTKGGTTRKLGGGSNNRFGGRTGLLHKKQPSTCKKASTPLQLKKRINIMRDHWIKRKRNCMDFVDALADGMEKKVKDVVNKVLELETDEAENAILPQKHVLVIPLGL
jgi:hypothetical protein